MGIRGAELDDFAFVGFRDEEGRLLRLSPDFDALDLEPFALNPEPEGVFRRVRLPDWRFRDLGPLCSETASWYSSDESGASGGCSEKNRLETVLLSSKSKTLDVWSSKISSPPNSLSLSRLMTLVWFGSATTPSASSPSFLSSTSRRRVFFAYSNILFPYRATLSVSIPGMAASSDRSVYY